MSAESDVFSSDGEEARFKALFRKHPQRFFQNVLGGLLSRATANPNNCHNSSKLNTHLYTLNFPKQKHTANSNARTKAHTAKQSTEVRL